MTTDLDAPEHAVCSRSLADRDETITIVRAKNNGLLRRAERAEVRARELEATLRKVRDFAHSFADLGWHEHGDHFTEIQDWCDEVLPIRGTERKDET